MRCSQLLGIRGETAALDLDLACAMRLLQFENRRDEARLKATKLMMREAILEALGGTKSDDDGVPDQEDFAEDDIL